MSEEEPVTRATHWSVDKKIPIALIVTLVLGGIGQTIGIVWWAAGVNAGMDQFKMELARIAAANAADKAEQSALIREFRAGAEGARDRTAQQLQDIGSRMTAVEVEMKALGRLITYPTRPAAAPN
jgi:hypothetical protein